MVSTTTTPSNPLEKTRRGQLQNEDAGFVGAHCLDVTARLRSSLARLKPPTVSPGCAVLTGNQNARYSLRRRLRREVVPRKATLRLRRIRRKHGSQSSAGCLPAVTSQVAPTSEEGSGGACRVGTAAFS